MIRRKFSASHVLLIKNLFSLKQFISLQFLIFSCINFILQYIAQVLFIPLVCYCIMLINFLFVYLSVLYFFQRINKEMIYCGCFLSSKCSFSSLNRSSLLFVTILTMSFAIYCSVCVVDDKLCKLNHEMSWLICNEYQKLDCFQL